MPAVNSNPNDWLKLKIREFAARLTRLENAQTFGLVDNKGQQRVLGGLLLDGTYGVEALDASGNRRAVLGQLANGDYGFEVIDPAGNSIEILPPVDAPDVDTEEQTASTTYTDLATVGPTCTADISSTGRVSVVVSAFIALPGVASSNPVGLVGLFVDGVLSPNRAIAESQISNGTGSAVGIGSTVAGQAVITGLSAGPHTFELKYRTSGVPGGQTIGFGFRTLSVQPL